MDRRVMGAGVVVAAVAAAWLAMPSTDTGEDVPAGAGVAAPPPEAREAPLVAHARAPDLGAGSPPGPGAGSPPGADRPAPAAPVGRAVPPDPEADARTSDRLHAAAARAVREKVAKVRDELDAAVTAVRDGRRRDELRVAFDRAVTRMRDIEDEVVGGVDPIEAYTRVHEVKQDAVRDAQQVLGDEVGPALEALGVAPDGTDPELGWGIPLEEVGWDAVFSEE